MGDPKLGDPEIVDPEIEDPEIGDTENVDPDIVDYKLVDPELGGTLKLGAPKLGTLKLGKPKLATPNFKPQLVQHVAGSHKYDLLVKRQQSGNLKSSQKLCGMGLIFRAVLYLPIFSAAVTIFGRN
jgi:hypothetical protein